MKTIKLLIIAAVTLMLAACNTTNNPNNPWKNDSNILGQLSYVANPLNPIKDSVLCLWNVQYVYCAINTDEYYSYVKGLLSAHDGSFEESETPTPRNDNHILFYPQPEICFFPIRNGKFISVMDEKGERVLDNFTLTISIEVGDRKDESAATIHMQSRIKKTGEYSQEFYLDDFVVFEGNDQMRPPFISDTITLDGTQIICFDGEHGPISASTPPQKK